MSPAPPPFKQLKVASEFGSPSWPALDDGETDKLVAQSSVVDSEDLLLPSLFAVLGILVSGSLLPPSRLLASELIRPFAAVSIYERRDFKLEVGASISCAANGTQVSHQLHTCSEQS